MTTFKTENQSPAKPVEPTRHPKFIGRVALRVKPSVAEGAELDPDKIYHTFYHPDYPGSGRKWDAEDMVWRYLLEEKLFLRRLYSEDIFEPVVL